ncbi:MAG: hypothetical protein ACHREM_01385 [Polyangiales bacterium]
MPLRPGRLAYGFFIAACAFMHLAHRDGSTVVWRAFEVLAIVMMVVCIAAWRRETLGRDAER